MDVITSIAVLMLILPAAGALLCALLKDRARSAAVAIAAIVTGLAVWLALATFGASYIRKVGTLPWLHGITGAPILGILIDPLASVMLLVAVPIGLLTVLYSTSYLTGKNREHPVGSEHYGRYYFWLLLFITSMVGVAVSPNFLQFLIFWEMTTMCSWALISFRQNERSLRAGFKALLMTHVGQCVLATGDSYYFCSYQLLRLLRSRSLARGSEIMGISLSPDCRLGEGGAGPLPHLAA